MASFIRQVFEWIETLIAFGLAAGALILMLLGFLALVVEV